MKLKMQASNVISPSNVATLHGALLFAGFLFILLAIVCLAIYFSVKREYYSKIKCQRELWDKAGQYLVERYVARNIFDPKLKKYQQMTIIQDIFDNSNPCPFGGDHENLKFISFLELARILVNEQKDNLTPEILGIILKWLANEYPNAYVGTIDKRSHLYTPRRTPIAQGGPDRVSHMVVDLEMGRLIRTLIHFPKTPRNVVFETFLGIISRIDETISPYDIGLDEMQVSFLRDYLTSMNRTHEEISLIAYKSYDWLKPILFESPKITESDKIASALASGG